MQHVVIVAIICDNNDDDDDGSDADDSYFGYFFPFCLTSPSSYCINLEEKRATSIIQISVKFEERQQ